MHRSMKKSSHQTRSYEAAPAGRGCRPSQTKCNAKPFVGYFLTANLSSVSCLFTPSVSHSWIKSTTFDLGNLALETFFTHRLPSSTFHSHSSPNREDVVGDIGRHFLRFPASQSTSNAVTIVSGPERFGSSQYKQEVNIQWQQGGPVPSSAVESPPPNMSSLLLPLCLCFVRVFVPPGCK